VRGYGRTMSEQNTAQIEAPANNKKSKVYEILKERIVKNELKPQEYLNEQFIARDLGVSKTPVREALQKLEHERLVVIIPNKGTFVSNVTIDRIREVFEIREILECAAARLAAKLPAKEQFVSILQSHPSFTIGDGAELRNQLLSGYQIHTRIVEAVENSYLTEYYENILAHIVQVRVFFIRRFGMKRLYETVEEHRTILRAIIDSDAEKAEMGMRDHLKRSLMNINQLMLGSGGET
jgi:GntR family transcriptional regulator, rspAB operon transcriptional repressor